MNRKLLIFVSSVQKEFAAERRAVRDFIEGDALLRRFFEVFLFENRPASGRRPDEVYLAEVERSAIYLGLFGNEYGFEDASGVSPTEREFDCATAAGKERLVFVKGSDGQARHPKMRALIGKASSQLNRRRFNSAPELTALVYASLVECLAVAGAIRTKPFDAAACPEATLDDISPEKLADFLELAQRSRGYALGPDTPTQKALTHLNLLDGEHPSHAAILLFGKAPQRFLVSSELKCMHFHTPKKSKPIPSYQIYKGTVFDLVDQAIDFVMSKLNRSVGTRAMGPQAPVEYDIPEEVVAEGIVNAVAHRDYAGNASVEVQLFPDRLEIWNPGTIHPPLTLEKLYHPHASQPNNPLIAEPLFLTKYIEKAGTGTVDMIERCLAAGIRQPEFCTDAGFFILTVWRKTTGIETEPNLHQVGAKSAPVNTQVTGEVAGEVTGEVARLLGIITIPMTRTEMQSALELKGQANFRDRYLQPAVTLGLIEMSHPDKPTSRLQKYRLTEKGRAWLAGRKQ